jgi:hypothetical protein
MTTYAKRPGQADRLAQTAQKRLSVTAAPEMANEVVKACRSGTTLAPLGATSPEMRRSRAAHSVGSAGRSSAKQETIKTSAGVATGSIAEPLMSDVGHSATSVPQRSSSTDSCILNVHRSRLSAFSDYNADLRPHWPRIGGIVAMFALWAGVIWAALTLIDAWSKV